MKSISSALWMLHLKSPLFQELSLKLFTPWECVNWHQSTGKTFTTGKSSKGHFYLPPVVLFIQACMCLFILRWQCFQDHMSVVAEIKKYFLSWTCFVFLSTVYLKSLSVFWYGMVTFNIRWVWSQEMDPGDRKFRSYWNVSEQCIWKPESVYYNVCIVHVLLLIGKCI